jgi:hypothetical protein
MVAATEEGTAIEEGTGEDDHDTDIFSIGAGGLFTRRTMALFTAPADGTISRTGVDTLSVGCMRPIRMECIRAMVFLF